MYHKILETELYSYTYDMTNILDKTNFVTKVELEPLCLWSHHLF